MNITDARAVVPFIGVNESDTLSVPGHDGRHYEVHLTEKTYWCGCRGAKYSVCYHGLAAGIKDGQSRGLSVSWTGIGRQGMLKAHRLVNLGGSIITLTSIRSHKVAWGVIKAGSTPIQVETIGRYPHRDKDGLSVSITSDRITIGENVYYHSSDDSRGRLLAILDRLVSGHQAVVWFHDGLTEYLLV